MKKILAFSSSRAGGGAYLESAVPVLQKFLGDKPLKLAFIPFASVDSYEDYATKVSEGFAALPHQLQVVDEANAKKIIERADGIIMGGGNTFKLLHDLYKINLLDIIKTKVESGTPYISWSAGSNLCAPTICTTNDMPIVQPESFEAFGFFPFQINPHYRNEAAADFHGETRDQRLEEFLKLNPGKQIMALPEGTWLMHEGNRTIFDGAAQGVRMTREEGQTIHEIINPGTLL